MLDVNHNRPVYAMVGSVSSKTKTHILAAQGY